MFILAGNARQCVPSFPVSGFYSLITNYQHPINTTVPLSLTHPDTHAVLMTSRDPYSEAETMELDPGLGPIKINSTVLNHEYILVQRITESNPVPLWVSAYRRPFRQAVFLEPMKQAVSLTHL